MATRMFKRNLFALIGLFLVALSCKSNTEPDPLVPTGVSVTPTAVTLTSIGEAEALAATVTDQNGAPLTATTTWASSNTAAVTVDAAGIVTAVAEGTSDVTAQAGTAVSNIVPVTVTPTVSSISKSSGDTQTGTVGAPLETSIVVTAVDELGTVVGGQSVTFTPAAGSGSIPSPQVDTDATGRASTIWTLGTANGAQTLNVTLGSLSLSFTATAVADVPDTVRMVSGDGQSALVSTALPEALVVAVTDRFGNSVGETVVSFTVTSGGGVVTPTTPVTDANGSASAQWTVGSDAGPNTVDAVVTGAQGSPVTFSATANAVTAPANVIAAAGDGQDLVVGGEAVIRPTALVEDSNGNPVAGTTVDFLVTLGDGSLAVTQAVTDANGLAAAGAWTYGATPGTNTVEATVTGLPSVTFSGEGVAAGGYNLEIIQLNTPSTEVATAFANAKARWENIVVSELADINFSSQPIGANACGITHPSFAGTVDDVMIWVRLEAIDGSGGVLGSAGHCITRATGGTTVVGIMRLDIADLQDLVDSGTIESVILHEMGHVMGIGTLWDNFGFLQDPSLQDTTQFFDTYFNGPTGLAAFETLGGGNYTGGAKVPVENTQGGVGTRDAHWRETVFQTELMTGFIQTGSNPLSLLTVASLGDIGLAINPAAADAYSQVFTVSGMFRGGGVEMKNDIFDGPRYTVGPAGQITRIK